MTESKHPAHLPRIFVSYARNDAKLAEKLVKHLRALEVETPPSAEVWWDQKLGAGEEWKARIEQQLQSADIFLALLSPDYIASDFCWRTELEIAMQRRHRGLTRVAPVLLKPVAWDRTHLGALQVLPDNGRPLSGGDGHVYVQVTNRLRDVALEAANDVPPGWHQIPIAPGIQGALTASHAVAPVATAENQLLQVLLTAFHLQRHGDGAKLSVHFDEGTPAIWTRRAKRQLTAAIPDLHSRWAAIQSTLDAVLDGKQTSYTYREPAFPFRYSNGGTLPILLVNGEPHFCFFYRDVEPIGWNIANGGADRSREFLNPIETIERELREELILVSPADRCRHVFSWDLGESFDRPEFVLALKLWNDHFEGEHGDEKDFRRYRERETTLAWIPGPDSLVVQMGLAEPRSFDSLFLTLTARDQAIEFDRIATIDPGDAIPLDGEIVSGELLQRPIGLFPVRSFDVNASTHIPKILYFRGKKCDPEVLVGEKLVGFIETRYLGHLTSRGLRDQDEVDAWRTELRKNRVLGLCPATESIVRRYAGSPGVTTLDARQGAMTIP